MKSDICIGGKPRFHCALRQFASNISYNRMNKYKDYKTINKISSFWIIRIEWEALHVVLRPLNAAHYSVARTIQCVLPPSARHALHDYLSHGEARAADTFSANANKPFSLIYHTIYAPQACSCEIFKLNINFVNLE